MFPLQNLARKELTAVLKVYLQSDMLGSPISSIC